MKIDIITNDGSPLGVVHSDIYGENDRVGIGGAELALLSMCEYWTEAGHTVRLYNDPKHPNDLFEQLPREEFQEGYNRDILIIFRSPNSMSYRAKGKKVWWSCDQQTVGNFREFAAVVRDIVVISDFHKKYFEQIYGIKNVHVIDLPVRLNDYELPKERVPNKLIFTSIPDRGLDLMKRVWNKVKPEIPDLQLFITSDYRLWGVESPRNENYRVQWIREKVKFLGAVPRRDLVYHQLTADLLVYPCTYDELFCIACAEAQVTGAYPVTSYKGALATTNMGMFADGDPVFNPTSVVNNMSRIVLELLSDRDKLESLRRVNMEKAKERFSPERILQEWDEKVFT